MRRIEKGYRAKLSLLLQTVGARRTQQGLAWLLRRAEECSAAAGIPREQALARVFEQVRQRIRRFARGIPPPSPQRFVCDAGLGGLARWLRAAGYEAHWRPDIDDDDLLDQARRSGAMLLTTDSLLMERRLLRDGIIPSLWLPPTLAVREQLRAVLRELRLSLRPPRCMSCGGELRRVDKDQVRERIPPRTYRWLQEYFVCAQCDKLFWQGTHWQRIQAQLPTGG
jgi:hypothetical protein